VYFSSVLHTFLTNFLGKKWCKIEDDESRKAAAMEKTRGFKAFWEKLGRRLPNKRAKDPEEKRHGIWFKHQKLLKNGKRCYSEVDKLLTTFLGENWCKFEDEESRKAAAMEKAREFKACWEELGRLPSHEAEDPKEKCHAWWFQHQKQVKNGKGNRQRCYPEVDKFLSTFLGGNWYKVEDEESRKAAAMEKAREFKVFWESLGRLPSNSAKYSPDERRHARWFQTQKGVKNGTDRSGQLCYPEVDKFLSSFLGEYWHVTRPRKRNASKSTSTDSSSGDSSVTTISTVSTDSTITTTKTLVKRPRLDTDPRTKLLELSHQELIDKLAKHQQRVSGRFPTEARDGDVDKQRCNDDFSAAALATQGLIVFLDSPAMFTTKYLLEKGVPLDRMVVPQFDTKEYEEMKAWLHVQPGSLRSVLESLEEETIGSIWMDYCCTWEGNQYISPKEDLELLVNRSLVKEGGCVVLTVTMQRVPTTKRLEDMHEIREIMEGWRVHKPFVYGNDMLFQVFTC